MSPLVAVRKWTLLVRLATSAIKFAGHLGLAGLVLFAAPVMGAEYTFELPDVELRELKASSPYFNRRFGRVTVESRVAADFLDEFRGALRDTFFASGAFDGEGAGRLSVRVVINELTKTGDVFPISYRAGLTYELYDKDEKVGAWQIGSYATSTNFSGLTREGHALTLALQRNIRGFFLSLKSSFDMKEAADAKVALDRLQGEYKSDSNNVSALAGYLVMGGAAVVKAAGSAADATLRVMASPGFAAGMSQAAADQARMNSQMLAVINPVRQSSRVDAGDATPSDSRAGASEGVPPRKIAEQPREKMRVAAAATTSSSRSSSALTSRVQAAPETADTSYKSSNTRSAQAGTQAAAQRDAEERKEKERKEKERKEKERLEKERLEKERLEKERLEKERLEKERLEKERLEKERLAKERIEKERIEKELIAREKEDARKKALEAERLAAEKAKESMPTALAFCWQNDKKTLWWCDGRVDEITIGEKDRDGLLKSVGCENARQISEGYVTLTRKRSGASKMGFVYSCGYKLQVGDTGAMTWNRDIRKLWNGMPSSW